MPLSPYAVSKVAQDYLGYQYFQSYGLKAIRTRGFNHTGPRRGQVFVTSNFCSQVAAIEHWGGKGKAPDQIVASHLTGGKVDRTRPLCPYGKIAKWTGGNTDDAANFSCVAEAAADRGTPPRE